MYVCQDVAGCCAEYTINGESNKNAFSATLCYYWDILYIFFLLLLLLVVLYSSIVIATAALHDLVPTAAVAAVTGKSYFCSTTHTSTDSTMAPKARIRLGASRFDGTAAAAAFAGTDVRASAGERQ